ncbi:hypothetical protein AAF712_000435 [Marasmius tenuissimus]|uniref:Uncharacterized protein n=1 Tax=Marasmius tenuissimus TaxID=585030 RepID=A0ABR3AJC4_9AGAR
MAKATKRTKSQGLKPGHKATIQRAAKKKSKQPDARSLRFKNAALKDSIDSQAHLLYAQTTKPVDISEVDSATTDRDLAAIIGNL